MSVDHAKPGRFTSLPSAVRTSDLPSEPAAMVAAVPAQVIQPDAARSLGLAEDRMQEASIRPAAALVQRLLELDDAPLSVPREPGARVVGTCRHFGLLACTLLRSRGIASRLRCGFATYFQPGQALDHWIVEYRSPGSGRWRRMDPEVLGNATVPDATNLTSRQFYSGTEAWQAFRDHAIDAGTFGVHGTENFGPAEIRGNVVKDLAALHKVEMLPWDEWGRMTQAYEGTTGADYDQLLDAVAEAAARDDGPQLQALYQLPEFRVPDALLDQAGPGSSPTVQ